MTPITTTLLISLCTMTSLPVYAETKGGLKMFDTQIASSAQDELPFFVGRTTPSPKSENYQVPRLDGSTVGDYASLAKNLHGFNIARIQNGILVSLEDWIRDRERIDLDRDISGNTLMSFTEKMTGNDPREIAPLFFMKTDPDHGLWTEVDVDATAGESRYILLRIVRDVMSDNLIPVASMVHQYKAQKTEYTYHMNGKLASITIYERATGFEEPTVRTFDAN